MCHVLYAISSERLGEGAVSLTAVVETINPAHPFRSKTTVHLMGDDARVIQTIILARFKEVMGL